MPYRAEHTESVGWFVRTDTGEPLCCFANEEDATRIAELLNGSQRWQAEAARAQEEVNRLAKENARLRMTYEPVAKRDVEMVFLRMMFLRHNGRAEWTYDLEVMFPTVSGKPEGGRSEFTPEEWTQLQAWLADVVAYFSTLGYPQNARCVVYVDYTNVPVAEGLFNPIYVVNYNEKTIDVADTHLASLVALLEAIASRYEAEAATKTE